MQVRDKVNKSQNTVFFPMPCASGGSKSGIAKAVGANHLAKLHAIVARTDLKIES